MSAARLRQTVDELSPAYFGLVMATGIASVDANLLDLSRTAAALFALNIAAYAVIWVLMVLRAIWFPRHLWRDIVDHQRGPGFFTIVAATGVLGTQCIVLAEGYRVAGCLWVLAVMLWLALTYVMFAALTIKQRKPPLDRGISGTWLLAVVATQAIAVLSIDLAAHGRALYRFGFDFLALSMWLWGGMLYIWMMSLIFYRYVFLKFAPGDFSPPWWINMGAMAISTFAGSLLIVNGAEAPRLAALTPFIKGFTVLCWATGTWWIPMLVVLTVWRHVLAGFSVRYDALWWSAVFPLGMYAVGTFEMAHALELGFLYPILPWLGAVALAAWTIAFVGLLRSLVRGFAARSASDVRISGEVATVRQMPEHCCPQSSKPR